MAATVSETKRSALIPVNIVCLLDASGSMNLVVDTVRKAFTALVQAQASNSDMDNCDLYLISFTGQNIIDLWSNTVNSHWSSKKVVDAPAHVQTAMKSYNADYNTPLYDTLNKVHTVFRADEKVLVIVFTDGMDNASRMSMESIKANMTLRRNHGWVYEAHYINTVGSSVNGIPTGCHNLKEIGFITKHHDQTNSHESIQSAMSFATTSIQAQVMEIRSVVGMIDAKTMGRKHDPTILGPTYISPFTLPQISSLLVGGKGPGNVIVEFAMLSTNAHQDKLNLVLDAITGNLPVLYLERVPNEETNRLVFTLAPQASWPRPNMCLLASNILRTLTDTPSASEIRLRGNDLSHWPANLEVKDVFDCQLFGIWGVTDIDDLGKRKPGFACGADEKTETAMEAYRGGHISMDQRRQYFTSLRPDRTTTTNHTARILNSAQFEPWLRFTIAQYSQTIWEGKTFAPLNVMVSGNASESNMIISSSGRNITCHVNDGTTVYGLAEELILNDDFIPYRHIKIFHSGRPFEYSRLLRDYGVAKESTTHAMVTNTHYYLSLCQGVKETSKVTVTDVHAGEAKADLTLGLETKTIKETKPKVSVDYPAFGLCKSCNVKGSGSNLKLAPAKVLRFCTSCFMEAKATDIGRILIKDTPAKIRPHHFAQPCSNTKKAFGRSVTCGGTEWMFVPVCSVHYGTSYDIPSTEKMDIREHCFTPEIHSNESGLACPNCDVVNPQLVTFDFCGHTLCINCAGRILKDNIDKNTYQTRILVCDAANVKQLTMFCPASCDCNGQPIGLSESTCKGIIGLGRWALLQESMNIVRPKDAFSWPPNFKYNTNIRTMPYHHLMTS